MSKKKVFHKEEYEVDTEELEKDIPETIEFELDPLDELKSCGADFITFSLRDPATGKQMVTSRILPTLLSWDWVLTNLRGGEYNVKAYVNGRGVRKQKIIHVDEQKTNENEKQPNISPHQDSARILAETLKEIITPLINKVSNTNSTPDMTIFMSQMGSAMGSGMKAAMSAVAEMIPKQSPDHMFTLMEMFFKMQDKWSSNSNSSDWKEKLLSSFGPVLEKMMMTPNLTGILPTTTKEENIKIEPSKPSIKIENENKLEEPANFLFKYMKFLEGRSKEIDPVLRANTFLEDIPENFFDNLSAFINQDNSFNLLKTYCPFIENNLQWFQKWWETLQSLVDDENDKEEFQSRPNTPKEGLDTTASNKITVGNTK